MQLLWLTRYEGYMKAVCRGVRDDEPSCIEQAARFFDCMLPKNSVIVPMPGHMGRADRMLDVAKAVKRLRPDVEVLDVLRCDPHPSSYDMKKNGLAPCPVRMWHENFAYDGDSRRPKFIIDNVICTGITAAAATAALDWPVLVLCKSTWR